MQPTAPSARQPTSAGRNLIAPVGGWNARDPLANMPAGDAIYLDNFFPKPASIELRPGSALWATLPPDRDPATPTVLRDVRGLMSYQSPAGVAKLFAACQTGIYEVTAGGTVSAISAPCTNGEWQFVNISTAGGSFLWCCNGVDESRYFNGTTWTLLNGTTTPALTGVTSTSIVNASLFKSRLYLCVKDSLSFWYLPVNSIAGLASEYPLGALFRRGGYLVATESWTLDGGNGPEDYFIAATSEGEVAVFQGTNPDNAATWALQGIYYIGTPIGRRCFLKLGSDLALLTTRGLYPLSRALQSATVDSRSAISDKITQAWLDYAQLGKGMFGWQPILHSSEGFLLVNVPVVSSDDANIVYSYQFVMNTQTKAWCRFTGMPAEVWATHDDKLYFALHNKVFQAWVGTDDVGKSIDGKVKSAFFYPAGKGNLSRVTLLRPIFQTSAGDFSTQLAIDTDYDEAELSYSAVSYARNAAVWDTAKWDESYWTASRTQAVWRTVASKPGRAISLRLRVLGKGITMSWNATDLILQKGGLM